ncbi:HAD family phosphatase [Flagellimonas alvinocaridis]|uniref:HAD family phosphatase n=1 Tax=Flagellimonas alvinocaridis TaxID=2530200 RepID=A0A4S8RPS6_9FLAO|nr:HAD family phosphatase [Allomuricauda alvinocaridis]THV59721.1 HAD family phosphatase [Allomuricauda alvinocaridis]
MIKNIILDFGDVFINLDKPAIAREMIKFGFSGITPELSLLFLAYEKGALDSQKFLEQVSGYFPEAKEPDLIYAWNSILKDFPDKRLTFLEQLAKENQHRLFLLSNTNDLHIEYIKQQMGMEKFNRFKDVFEVFYLSYEMGMSKPDAEIFEFVLEQNDLTPSETLFVDDTKENTDAAAELGIHTWNLLVGQEDITQLKRYL